MKSTGILQRKDRNVSVIRPARLDELAALVDLENRCFVTDRLSARSFRYMLTKGNAETLVEETSGVLRGYCIVLFNAGTSIARLYSIAVDPDAQGQGVGRALVQAAEHMAIDNDCMHMRLEIRIDNRASIALFKKCGYKQFGSIPDYYEDHMDALRCEKSLAPQLDLDMVRVPFYEQTLDFTCGPAAIMMAMKAFRPDLLLDRKMELRIWRESTTIFMTSGHGGCSPYGMALAAYHRGFDVEVYVNDEGAMFLNTVRDLDKKEVMRLAQEDFLEELQQLPIKFQYGALKVAEIQQKFEEGGIPIVLISSYRIYHEKFPHWVVVTGFDEKYIYVHDPFVDYEFGKTLTESINMPIFKKDFERMARYGKAAQKAVIVLKARSNTSKSSHAKRNPGVKV
jgi:ribosomal protein S18 acetylase RimI-like enzyme